MHFQVTERITTNAPITDVGNAMLTHFRSIALSAVPVNKILRVTSIDASFGSINRTDVTDIAIRPTDDGYLLVADVEYRPSVAFWVILIITLFTWVFWLIPIVFYLVQKETVKKSIEEGFRNVKNELSRTPAIQPHARPTSTAIADLERLGGLLQQGLITQEEFNSQKQKLLGIEPQDTPANTRTPPPVPTNHVVQNTPGTENENEAQRSFDQARECVTNGQKEMAVEILKDLIKRFPDTKAAARARKSLAPHRKT